MVTLRELEALAHRVEHAGIDELAGLHAQLSSLEGEIRALLNQVVMRGMLAKREAESPPAMNTQSAACEHSDEAEEDKPLDTKKAAPRIGVKPSTLRKWRVQGRGPAFYKLGSAVRYKATDVEEYRKACRRRSTADRGGGSTE